jgi:hypothetical protein
MALQQINWTQIDTSNVPSGSIIDLGAVSGALHAVYAENLYADEILVSGQTLTQIISDSGTAEINIYTASLKEALETTGSNLTVKGNLLVKGTTTSINSTTVAIGDNIIELNGTAATNGGLLIKDPTSPNTISGSLLWDSSLDYWKAGQLGSEEKIILISELNSATSSLSASINSLSGSLSSSISNISSSFSASIANLQDTNIWQPTGSFFATTNDLQITGSLKITSGSAVFGSNLTANNSDLYLTSGSGLYIKDNALVDITGSLNMSGSVVIKGDLTVEGKTTLIQKLDPNVESLVVSGAMSIVQNQINSQVVAASLTIQNLGTWADRSNNSVIDCGDGFF